MGVSGSGKTTIGRLLAERMGWTFADADDYHPRLYKQKMASGHPLTDEDRAPWLALLNRLLKKWDKEGTHGVLACSALKAKYRERLGAGVHPELINLIFLDGSRDLLAERLSMRSHEFMNPQLLESQLITLEPPENAFRIVNERSPKQIVNEILEHVLPGQEARSPKTVEKRPLTSEPRP
jgi:gluconokinase